MNAPSVAVIVLNWCGEEDTVACVESLRRSTYPRLSILVVDNASPDGSGDRLRARLAGVEVLQTGANLGYAGGNNRGFDRVLKDAADYVLVLNNDTVVDPECVAALVETARRADAALVAPKILYHDAPHLIWYAGGDFLPARALGRHRREGELDATSPARAEPITFATGCCFLIRADVLRALGGFDESYFAYVEDVELSLRITRAGLRMFVEPNARLYHRIPVGAEVATPFQLRQRDRNRRRLVRTHFNFWQRLAFAAWFYPTRAIHFLRYILAGAWPQARAVFVGMFGSLHTNAGASTDISSRSSRRATTA
jgi:GT2 family glycosyltransferase